MMSRRLLVSLFCAAILSACALPAQFQNVGTRVPSLGTVMADADTAVKAGQKDKALALLKGTAGSFPADKAPWLRMAQLHFDNNNYGEAIVNALEALARDPDDVLAHSIVAVSGLRLSSRSLAGLTKNKKLAGPVRTEAQDLAKLLRASLGEDELVPPVVKTVPRPSAPRRVEVPRAPKPSSGNDPFSILR
jgi:predicted Zn-dependent protease